MTSQSYMNSAAAKMDFAYPIGPANDQYYGYQAGTKINDEGHNPSLFSDFDPIQHNLNAAHNLDSMMVKTLLNPACHTYNSEALSQPLPPVYCPTLPTQYNNNMHSQLCGTRFVELLYMGQDDQYLDAYDPVLAPAPARATPNPSAEEDTITFGQCLARFGLVRPEPVKPPSSVDAITDALVPTPNHNQIIQGQDQHFLPQNDILSVTDNAASNWIIQKPKRRVRISDPTEVTKRKVRRMIKNRDSAARSRARKRAEHLEMKAELSELREENARLKEMLLEIQNGGKKLKRTKSWV
ncbi:unnamed protein product [Rhodiola kirilowii]